LFLIISAVCLSPYPYPGVGGLKFRINVPPGVLPLSPWERGTERVRLFRERGTRG